MDIFPHIDEINLERATLATHEISRAISDTITETWNGLVAKYKLPEDTLAVCVASAMLINASGVLCKADATEEQALALSEALANTLREHVERWMKR